MIRLARLTSIGLGIAVLAWQVVNASHGRFLHAFLVPDLVLAAGLILAAARPDRRDAAVAMLAGHSAMAGVFLSATTGRILMGEPFSMGTALTTVGVIPCVTVAFGLSRWLIGGDS